MRNSVLEEIRVRRFADIHEEICCRADWRWAILESKLRAWNEEKIDARRANYEQQRTAGRRIAISAE